LRKVLSDALRIAWFNYYLNHRVFK
jgi:hypothetical protein